MRVVFDSNIFVSALTLPGRQADKAVVRIIEGRDDLVISRPIIDEVLGVLARKFGRDAEDLARAAIFLAELGDLVIHRMKLSVFADEADNRILECALSGRASTIVTGDRAMLNLRSFRSIDIISLRSYLDRE